MLIGYGRVSTAGQTAVHQVDALRHAGVAERDIHIDVASGAKASRPELDVVLHKVRAGDQLVITRLDRLGRSVLHLVTLGVQLRERDVGLRVLEQGIDTDTPEGRAMFGMLSVLAELQRELTLANTHDGLAAARARGRVGGRPPALTPAQQDHVQSLYDAREMTVQEIAELVGVPRSTVYAHLNRRDYALVVYRSERQQIDDRGRPFGETLNPVDQLEADAKWWRIAVSKRPRLRAMVFVANGVVARIRPVLRGGAWVAQPDGSGRVRAPLGPELVTEDDFAAADLSTLAIRPGDPRPTVQGRQRESVAL